MHLAFDTRQTGNKTVDGAGEGVKVASDTFAAAHAPSKIIA